jgi:glycosyltransferase involved in cell wall biosynthesis
MNILLLHQYFLDSNEGGGSRFNEMTKIWVQQGHKVTVLAGMVHYAEGRKNERFKGKYVLIEENDDGVKIIRSHVSNAYNVNFAGRLWAYFSFVLSSCFTGLFKARESYDLLVATSPPLLIGISATLIGRIKGIPIVFEVRDLWPESAIDTGVLTNKWMIRAAYWLEGYIYRVSDLINVLTPAFRDNLIAKGVPEKKITFIPNAADFRISEEVLKGRDFDRERFRDEQGWDGKKIFIYVGAHGVANNLMTILEAADLLRDNPAIMFVLIGSGMEKPKLEAEADKNGLTNVQFLNSVSKQDVFKYIYSADIGISILKKAEAFKAIYSNKTFDYMACKRPVIVAIDGVSRQLVAQAQCGVYVEPENATDLAEKVKYYSLESESKLADIGGAGYLFAKKHFDRQILATEYMDHLEQTAALYNSAGRTSKN